jgi:hypothetical protein
MVNFDQSSSINRLILILGDYSNEALLPSILIPGELVLVLEATFPSTPLATSNSGYGCQ